MRVVATQLSIIRNRPPIDDGPECERCDEVAIDTLIASQ